MANITFYSLYDYNCGRLVSKTFDLDVLDTYDALAEARQEWLEELTEHCDDGVLREEWIVADYEGVHSSLVGEWDIDTEFGEYLEVCAQIGAEVVDAGLAADIPLDSIEEAYCGAFDSDEAFAEEHIESTGMLSSVPDSLQCYFDVERFARDLMMDYTESDGHYFHLHY